MLSNFYCFWGTPWREWWWVGGLGWDGCGCVGVSHPCMHAPMHACTHMHVVNMINMDASMGAAICNFYTCIHVFACACMCMHACACTHVWGHLHAPRHPQPTCLIPRAAGSPKHQNSISLELIKIF